MGHISSTKMESGSRFGSDDVDTEDIEENPFCIESSHPQQLDATYIEDIEDTGGEDIGDC